MRILVSIDLSNREFLAMARSSQCDMAMANQKQKETAKRICRTGMAAFNDAIDDDDDDNDNHIGLFVASSLAHGQCFKHQWSDDVHLVL